MSILSELNTLLSSIPHRKTRRSPQEARIYANNHPGLEVQEARISLFTKGNYQQRKRQITTALLNAGMAITDRRYIGHEDDTGYHHYAIDVAHHYELEE